MVTAATPRPSRPVAGSATTATFRPGSRPVRPSRPAVSSSTPPPPLPRYPRGRPRSPRGCYRTPSLPPPAATRADDPGTPLARPACRGRMAARWAHQRPSRRRRRRGHRRQRPHRTPIRTADGPTDAAGHERCLGLKKNDCGKSRVPPSPPYTVPLERR